MEHNDTRNDFVGDSYSYRLHIANLVKLICERKNVTISQLAMLSGLSELHIDRIWNAEMKPSHAVLSKIAIALEVPIERFFANHE